MSAYWIGKQVGFSDSGHPLYVICWIKNNKRVTSNRSEALDTLRRLQVEYGHQFNYMLFEEEV